MEDNNNPKKRGNKPMTCVGTQNKIKMEHKYIQNEIQSSIKRTEVIKNKNIKKLNQTEVIQNKNKKPNPFYNKGNSENQAKPKTQLSSHINYSKKQNIEKNQPKNEIISDNVAGNISESTSTNYEPINDSGKKYNTGIKSNINKINIKEPYSTILRIESGIDLSHYKLGQK